MDLVDVLVEAGSDMEAICEVSILSVIVHKICYIPYFRLFRLLGLLPLQAFLQQTLLFFDTTCQMPHFILPIEKESAHFRKVFLGTVQGGSSCCYTVPASPVQPATSE